MSILPGEYKYQVIYNNIMYWSSRAWVLTASAAFLYMTQQSRDTRVRMDGGLCEMGHTKVCRTESKWEQ